MRDIFISHVEEDYAVVLEIAGALEAAGYTTWYYERDGAAGASYLVQTRDAIVAAKAMLLVISHRSLASTQVTKEVVRAHESHKPFIPVRLGVSSSEYKRLQPEWEEAIGAATSVAISPEGPRAIIPRVLHGLQLMGIAPGAASLAAGHETRTPPAMPVAPVVVSSGGSGVSALAGPASAAPVPGLGPRVVVVGLLAAVGFVFGLLTFFNWLTPAPNSVEAGVTAALTPVRTINLFVNAVNVPLQVVVLCGCWLASQRRSRGPRLVRRGALGLAGMDVFWIVMVLFSASSHANWPLFKPEERAAFTTGTLQAGGIALVFAGVMWLLFRQDE